MGNDLTVYNCLPWAVRLWQRSPSFRVSGELENRFAEQVVVREARRAVVGDCVAA